MSFPPPAPPLGPGGLDAETRGWGVAAHLSAFAGAWLLVAFVGPLVVYLLGRDRHPSIAHHAREALNFQLTVFAAVIIASVAAGVLVLGTFGLALVVLIPLAAVVGLVWIILVIVAAVRAWDGEAYRYPLTIRFVR